MRCEISELESFLNTWFRDDKSTWIFTITGRRILDCGYSPSMLNLRHAKSPVRHLLTPHLFSRLRRDEPSNQLSWEASISLALVIIRQRTCDVMPIWYAWSLQGLEEKKLIFTLSWGAHLSLESTVFLSRISKYMWFSPKTMLFQTEMSRETRKSTWIRVCMYDFIKSWPNRA